MRPSARRCASSSGRRRRGASGCPTQPDGYIVLGMGKYGAFELNYSSDIDLIVFYDLARIRLRAGAEVQHFFVRLTRDLVRLLHERTGDGYVFRTDLRLRPDPAATPLALSTEAALNYYESFGQNWERAALIKARPVAGDLDGRQGRAGRPRALHLAQVSRLCGHRRHPRHEAADPRLPRLRRDRRGRPQHQGRARRHPRGGVLRADPAADRRRAPARAARQRDAGGARAAGAARLDHRQRRARAGRRLSLPAHGRASPADDRRRADADAARRMPTSSTVSPASAALPMRMRSRRD